MAFIFNVSRHTKLLFDGLTKNLFFLYDRDLIIFCQLFFFSLLTNSLGYQQGVLELKLWSQLMRNTCIIIDKNISKRVW